MKRKERYSIVFVPGSDPTHQKWIPSADLELVADNLFAEMTSKPERADRLVVPFVLTLAAALEANLNDWLLVDTYQKHGRSNYRNLADALLPAQFRLKLRLAVAVLTDNAFQLREESPVVAALDELIAVRNQLTHAKAYFYEGRQPADSKKRRAPFADHPLHKLDLERCTRFHEAFKAFEDGFFRQYGRGVLKGNDLIRPLKRIVIEEPPASDEGSSQG